jgi:predicted small metal-binding protein
MKTFKIIIDYTAEGESEEELKKRIISHMARQSLDMEMSIPNIRIEEIEQE